MIEIEFDPDTRSVTGEIPLLLKRDPPPLQKIKNPQLVWGFLFLIVLG
jgi:hypothetical protein